MRVTRHEVEVFHEHESLCLHRRVVKGQRSTVDAHLPEKRVSQRHRSTEYWLTKARMIGPEALRLAEEIFASDDVLSQLRRVQAVITLLEKFPLDRARRTAARALHFQSLSYGSIKNILTRGLDFEPLPTSEQKAWSEGSVFARDPREFRKE